MQVRKLQADVQCLREHKQEVNAKAASLESDLSNLKDQLKAEKERAQQAHQSVIMQQEARTPVPVGCSLFYRQCR